MRNDSTENLAVSERVEFNAPPDTIFDTYRKRIHPGNIVQDAQNDVLLPRVHLTVTTTGQQLHTSLDDIL